MVQVAFPFVMTLFSLWDSSELVHCLPLGFSFVGPLQHKFLRALLPFWSSALPTLPVTAPARKDALNANDVSEGRVRHQRSSRMDPRKVLLIIALM